MNDYTTFLQSKIDIAQESGFAVSPDEQISSPTLFDLLGIGG